MRSRVETEDGTEPSAGMLVTPTIRLVRPLRSGGMGTLWLADHAALKATVVVKFMSRLLASDPRAQARFAREAAAASQLKSPHVVQIFDYGVTAGGLPYIVMEHLEGEDLGSRLAHDGKLAPEAVVAIVEQVARALARAEAKGIVHRDVKPENIFLVDVGGEVFAKLLDFGIARADVPDDLRMTDTGTAIGTPFYMSPEQIVGSKSLDHRSDVWSLAVVAIEALTGEQPFRGDTHGGIAIAINNGPLPVLSEIDPARFTPAADAWVERACARDPAKRTATARELAQGLAEALGVAPSRAPFASVPDRSEPEADARTGRAAREEMRTAPITFSTADLALPARRRTAGRWAMVLGATVAALGAGGAVVWSRASRTAPPAVAISSDALAASSSPALSAPTPHASEAPAVPAPPVAMPPAKPTLATLASPHVKGWPSQGAKQAPHDLRSVAHDAGSAVTRTKETADDDALK